MLKFKNWLPVVLTALLTWTSGMGAGNLAGAQPALVCDEPEFHFPPTDNTLEIEHAFALYNAGTTPLVIRRVQPDCGCLLVRTPPDAIEPGDRMELSVRFALKGRRGAQRRRITLETNDPKRTRLTLTMIGEALAEAAVRPDRLFWGNIRADKPESQEAFVEFLGTGTGNVVEVIPAHTGFEADIEVVDIGQTHRLIMRTRPPMEPGRFDFPVTIRTDHPRFPELTLQMSGRVVAPVFAIPDEITLDASTTRPISVLAIIRSIAGEPFKILQVMPPTTAIHTNPAGGNPAGGSPAGEWNVRQRAMSGGGVRLECREVRALPELDGQALVITTDHPEAREIRIPIRVRAQK